MTYAMYEWITFGSMIVFSAGYLIGYYKGGMFAVNQMKKLRESKLSS